MDVVRYLDRIGLSYIPRPTEENLFKIHQQHILKVPFENLDIQFGRKLSLNVNDLYTKIVSNNRGGFCYELNYLFNELLVQLGYKSHIISCRIFNSEGNRGPAYDHMAIVVEHDRSWLLDVGFGDLFMTPMAIEVNKIQNDERNYFKIEESEEELLLSMSKENDHFEKKYTFSLNEAFIADFVKPCYDKETNPDSYFVKNLLCTAPDIDGRTTIFNNKLIVKRGGEKKELVIKDYQQLKHILNQLFGISL